MIDGRHRRLGSLLLVAACTLVLAACAKKAVYRPDGRGGYTLSASTDSLAQAMERFQNTAQGLCPQGSYDFGEAVVDPQATTPATYEIDLICTAP